MHEQHYNKTRTERAAILVYTLHTYIVLQCRAGNVQLKYTEHVKTDFGHFVTGDGAERFYHFNSTTVPARGVPIEIIANMSTTATWYRDK